MSFAIPQKIKVIHIPYMGHSNPYQELLFESLARNSIEILRNNEWESADIIHLHWINPLCIYDKLIPSLRDFIRLKSRLLNHKNKGKRIVWTIHNIISHESRHLTFERFVRKWVLKIVDVAIVHGPSAKEMLVEYFGNNLPPIEVILHPNYIGYYPNTINNSEARIQLGIKSDDYVFLFLGEIRPYKGVMELISNFMSSFAKKSSVRLIIAGRIKEGEYKKSLEQLINSDPRIIFKHGFIEDDKIQVYMNAADVVVFPYRRILSSGAVMLAMSFSKACIAPKIGCIPDVLDNKGAFLYSPEDKNYSLKDAMLDSYNRRNMIKNMGIYNFGKVKPWTWNNMADCIANIYQSFLHRT